MNMPLNQNEPTKTVVTVSEMAQMVGLSRSRFYQLMKAGVFPPPVYGMFDRRAHYVEAMQRVCLQVRRQNCGINGQPVFFYAHRIGGTSPSSARPQKKVATSRIGGATEGDRYGTIFIGVLGLGLDVTAEQVTAAVNAEYPSGVAQVTEAEVIRHVFLRLKRRNTGDSVGR